MASVSLTELEKAYGQTRACADLTLHIRQGELFTFLGPSGCGKTTLLRLIAGFINPDKGTIHVGEIDITRLAPEKRKIGMVFQNYALFPFMSVAENIGYGLAIQKKNTRQRDETVARYLHMVGLTGFERRNVAELSGGEQQRVALARSLAVEPAVLLLDEPLSNLDARLRDRMRVEIKELQQRLRITTIFVTHDQAEALSISDRIAVFNRGECIQVGSPEEIYNSPATSFVAGFVGETNLFPAIVRNGTAQLSDRVALQIVERGPGNFVSIRPQNIAVWRGGSNRGANVFAARVKSIHFSGVTVEYHVYVEDLCFRLTFLNTAPNAASAKVGDELPISIAAESVAVLPA